MFNGEDFTPEKDMCLPGELRYQNAKRRGIFWVSHLIRFIGSSKKIGRVDVFSII